MCIEAVHVKMPRVLHGEEVWLMWPALLVVAPLAPLLSVASPQAPRLLVGWWVVLSVAWWVRGELRSSQAAAQPST